MSTFTVYQTSTVEPQFTHVIAEEMTDTHFSYRCDCRLKSHRHGNGRDLTNRQEYRDSHCSDNPRDVCIHITDQTIRNLNSINLKSIKLKSPSQ